MERFKIKKSTQILNDQILFEQLSFKLDILNEQIGSYNLNGNFSPDKVENYIDISKSSLSLYSYSRFQEFDSNTCVNWYKSTQVRKRNSFYRSLKNRINQSLETSLGKEGNLHENFHKRNQKKILLLNKAIEYSEVLSQEFDESLLAKLDSVHEDLLNYLSKDEVFLLLNNATYIVDISAKDIVRKAIRNELRRISTKIKLRWNRDLKRFFRSIIRFLFKNMDDESGAEIFFSKKNTAKDFVIHQIFKNEYRRMYSAT